MEIRGNRGITDKQGDSNSEVVICFVLNLSYPQIEYSYGKLYGFGIYLTTVCGIVKRRATEAIKNTRRLILTFAQDPAVVKHNYKKCSLDRVEAS